MWIDDHPHVGMVEAALVEERRILIGFENRGLHAPAAERGRVGLAGGDLGRDGMRHVRVHGRDLKDQLPARLEGPRQARDQLLMARDPVQGAVGGDEIELAVGVERLDAGLLELEARRAWIVLGGGDHARRLVDANRVAGVQVRVEQACETAGAAPEIHDTHVGHRAHHLEQVDERLLTFPLEPGVLLGIPRVDGSHAHGPVSSGDGKGRWSRSAGSASRDRLWTLTPSRRTGRRPASVRSSNWTARA